MTDRILGYASFVSVLDYTNVVIPVTTASSELDAFDHDYKPLNEKDKHNWEACKSTTLRQRALSDLRSNAFYSDETDDPVAYDGAPAAVQILGRRLEEEKILSIAPRVVEALKNYIGKVNL